MTVDKLPSGSWRARVAVKKNGKWTQVSFIAGTRKEVERKAANFSGVVTGTIGEMIETYIDAKNDVLSPATIRGYKSIERTLRTRHSELWRLSEVSPADAQALANEYSAKTARNVIGLITTACKFSGYAFPEVTFKRWELKTDYIPDEKDISKLIKAVTGTKMELPVLLGLMGLRRSEVVAVMPEDLDGNRLHIHSAIVLDADDNKVRKGTKTRGSDRVITLPKYTADLLRQGPVQLSINSIGKRFDKIKEKIGVSMRFHDLRHFFVSYCHNVLRLTDAQIMKLGGYSTDAVMKRHYRQSMHDDKVADKVARAFSHDFSHARKKMA